MIRPELLKCFIAAADTGSFSAAARQLGRHLATVSGNIARLEDELGVKLFDREGKYPQITEAGLSLYDGAKVVVDSAERFNNNALQLSKGTPAAVTVAVDENLPIEPLAESLMAFQRRWPHIRLSCLQLSATAIFDGVKERTIDIALAPTLEGNSSFYEFMALGHIQARLVVGNGHPLAKRKRVSNDQLMATTQILPDSVLKHPSLLETSKMSPYVWFASGYYGVISMVKNNLGWALLQNGHHPLPDGITEVDADFARTVLMSQYDAIWQKNRPLGDVEQFFIDEFQQQMVRIG